MGHLHPDSAVWWLSSLFLCHTDCFWNSPHKFCAWIWVSGGMWGLQWGWGFLEGGVRVRLLMSLVPAAPSLCMWGVIQKGPLGLWVKGMLNPVNFRTQRSYRSQSTRVKTWEFSWPSAQEPAQVWALVRPRGYPWYTHTRTGIHNQPTAK